MTHRRTRAYVLPLVLMMTSVLAVAAVTLYLSLSSSAGVSRRLVQRKAAFHATDGMMRATLREANAFLRTTALTDPAASTAALQGHFTSSVLTPLVPSGYVLEKFTILSEGMKTGVVPNGAFSGMNARLFPVTATVKLRRPTGDNAAAEVTTGVVLAQIAAFQFFLFGEGYVDWFPAPTAAAKGRSHVNGTFCLGGANNFALERVTSSDGIYQISDDPNCRYNEGNRVNLKVAVAGACPDFPTTAELDGITPTQSDFSGPGFNCLLRELEATHDHGTSGWAGLAQTRWAGNVLDKDHAITALKLPVTGTPLVQAGFNASVRTASGLALAAAGGPVEPNLNNLRMLIDPLLPASKNEPQDVMKQKMMFKADLRIINGVWYMRDEAHPENIGTPIWSDHPGSMSWSPDGDFAGGGDDTDTGIRGGAPTGVGQADIGAARLWAGAVPRRYSYYETDLSTSKVVDNSEGIISYGTLFRDPSSGGFWKPGFRGAALATIDPWCSNTPLASALVAVAPVMRSSIAPCGARSVAQNLLHATRSGIKDGHAVSHGFEPTSPTVPPDGAIIPPNLTREARAKMLPINFDVAALQAALQDTSTPGELGHAFVQRGTPFNGIVYITSTWTGQNDNYRATADGLAAPWPTQGQNGGADPLAAKFAITAVVGQVVDDSQANLPWQLCGKGFAPGTPFEAGGKIVINDCSAASVRATRPNLLRIINGRHINTSGGITVGTAVIDPTPRPLPRGLSIVTNLPVMVVGDLNADSDVFGPSDWTPVMIGGDTLYHVSNAWDDARDPWAGVMQNMNSLIVPRDAADTVYNAAWITGWTVTDATGTTHSGGIQNITRYLEDWAGGGNKTQKIGGAFLVGYAAVHTRTTVAFKNTAFGAPNRDWAFDPHFDSLDNQPPGAPEFNISSTRSWQRK